MRAAKDLADYSQNELLSHFVSSNLHHRWILSSTLSQHSVVMVWIVYSKSWSSWIFITDFIHLQVLIQTPSLSQSAVNMDHYQRSV